MCLSDSDAKLPLFGRALRSEVKLDPVDLLGKKYKVAHSPGRGSHVNVYHFETLCCPSNGRSTT